MGRHGAGLKELRIWKTPAVVPPPPPVPTPSQINWVTGRRLHALHSIRVAGVVNGWLTPIWQNSGQCCLIAALLPLTPARSFWFAARWAKKDRRTGGGTAVELW